MDQGPFLQDGRRIRFAWGPVEAAALAPVSAYAVVVDVLSFSTAVSVAVDRGTEVFPYRWRDASARSYAEANDAVLAADRRSGGEPGGQPGGPSLSPASIRDSEAVRRLVLPSPNGSTIAAGLAAGGAVVLAACLRNRTAVAAWLADRAGQGEVVLVVASGERWPDGSLRPAVEDLWGAGGIIAALADRGADGASPEARAAEAAYRGVLDPAADLLACASGRELVDQGFDEDVLIAAELDVSPVVPVLVDGRFQDRPAGDGVPLPS